MSEEKIIGRKIKLPPQFKKTITYHEDCPFYDDGDSGYGCHCNLAEIERLPYKDRLCSLERCRYLELVVLGGEKPK